MGLTSEGGTLIAPAPKGVLDPATGKPIGANDPYFTEINNELADKSTRRSISYWSAPR